MLGPSLLRPSSALDPAPLLRPAAVVRDRRDVFDADDFDAGGRQRADRGLAARARAPDQHVHLAHAVLHGPPGARLGRQLGGKRRRLARALEAHVAGRRPRQHVALEVGDGDDGVVEGALDVGHAVIDVLALAAAGAAAALLLGLPGHLLAHLLLAGNRLLGALAGPGVGVGPLAVDRQALAVADALVAVDLHLALDVLGHVAAQVTLHPQVGVDVVAQADDLLVGQVAHPCVRVDLGARQNLARDGRAHTVDVGEGHLHALVAGDVDAGDPGHVPLLLALPLLVAGVLADHHDAPVAADHLALLADGLDARSDLHVVLTCTGR